MQTMGRPCLLPHTHRQVELEAQRWLLRGEKKIAVAVSHVHNRVAKVLRTSAGTQAREHPSNMRTSEQLATGHEPHVVNKICWATIC